MAPQRPSERATPTAFDPRDRMGMEGTAAHCSTCGSDCVCGDRSTSTNSGGSAVVAAAPVWVEREESPLLTTVLGQEVEPSCRVDGTSFIKSLQSSVQLEHLHLMAQYLYMWPDATPDSIRAYIYEQTGSRRLYSCEEIEDALYPFSPRSIHRWAFMTQPPPCGVATVQRRQLLDVAEFGLEFVKAVKAPPDNEVVDTDGAGSTSGASDRSSTRGGSRHDTLLVQKPWCYGPSTCMVVFLGVEAGDPSVPDRVPGSVARPRLWFHLVPPHLLNGGTVDLANFVKFICRCLVSQPAPYGSDRCRVITWDDHPTRNRTMIYDAVLSESIAAIAATDATPEGPPPPPGFDASPFVGIPRPLSHPGRGPAKRCLLDAIDTIVRRRHADPTMTSSPGRRMEPDDWIRDLQDVLSTELSWDGNARRWFDQYSYGDE